MGWGGGEGVGGKKEEERRNNKDNNQIGNEIERSEEKRKIERCRRINRARGLGICIVTAVLHCGNCFADTLCYGFC